MPPYIFGHSFISPSNSYVAGEWRVKSAGQFPTIFVIQSRINHPAGMYIKVPLGGSINGGEVRMGSFPPLSGGRELSLKNESRVQDSIDPATKERERASPLAGFPEFSYKSGPLEPKSDSQGRNCQRFLPFNHGAKETSGGEEEVKNVGRPSLGHRHPFFSSLNPFRGEE